MTRTLLVLLLILCGSAVAQTLRCGSQLIVPGDTKYEVLKACGEPAYREVISGADERKVEQWIYTRRGQLPKILTFRGMTLSDIETKTK